MDRYNRQELFLGEKNQSKFENVEISVVGLGGLGSVVSEMLVRSGVKNLIIIDKDTIDESNLQRQALYSEKDIGKLKGLVAEEKLKEINSKVKILTHCADIDEDNIELIKADIIIDCTDNFETRFLINKFCIENKIPWIFGTVSGSKGMTFNVLPGKACLNCIFKKSNEILGNCSNEGILNTIVRVIAGVQVTEAMKIAIGEKPRESLLVYDAWKNEYGEIKVNKLKECGVCK